LVDIPLRHGDGINVTVIFSPLKSVLNGLLTIQAEAATDQKLKRDISVICRGHMLFSISKEKVE
jgi:hypothetical protein